MTGKKNLFALRGHKKLAGAVALFAVCGLTAGCDDYAHHHPHPHPRPPHEDWHEDHNGHRPPPRDDAHHGNRHRDGQNGHHPPPKDGNHHQRPDSGHHRHERRRHASLVGAYYARALNDAVAPKGTTIPLNVVQKEDESLHLVDPTGKQYPIQFDAETGTGNIAGGSLSLREDGLFVYKDAKGGVWLVERQ